jgi:hypothetical protein
VCGGGLTALLAGSEGLHGLFQESGKLAGRLEVFTEEGPISSEAGMRAGSGTWHRTIHLPSGGSLEERGLLADNHPAAVVQWTLRSGPAGRRGAAGDRRILDLRLHLPPPHAPLELRLLLAEGAPVAVLLLPRSSEPMAAARSLAPLAERERQRVGRLEQGGIELRLGLDGSGPTPPLADALLAIEEASLGLGPMGRPTGPFLEGVADGLPTFLSGVPLGELGVAALAAGRFGLARGVLDALVSAAHPQRTVLARLANRWVEWTGRPAPSSFASAKEGSPFGPAPANPRLLLPVVGGGRPGGAEEWIALSAPLPPPESFGSPDLPAFALRRTVYAARLIRSWVEGALGARPDASVGRLRLAPRIRPTWSSLGMTGMRMGDVSITLECRREPREITFVLRQEGGRIPIQLVFEPHLPLARVSEVRIADAVAEVGLVPEGAGVRLSCQFPLDPERRVTIVG